LIHGLEGELECHISNVEQTFRDGEEIYIEDVRKLIETSRRMSNLLLITDAHSQLRWKRHRQEDSEVTKK
jgi:hypothetical protein